jgi:hypothetical protein
MTTEIAVLNRLGVALAADSAVTISGGGTTKVFDSADKLFELSCVYPVAIMLNGNMDCFGVPWEVIIKDFREHDGSCPRGSIKFLEGRPDLGNNAAQRYVEQVAIDELFPLRDKLWADPKVFRKSANDVMPPLITEAVTKRREDIAKMPVAKTLEQLSPDELMSKYEHLLNSIIESRFKPWKMPEEIRRITVRLLIVDAIRAVLPSPLSSGLIVAGYGKDDNYLP